MAANRLCVRINIAYELIVNHRTAPKINLVPGS